MVKLEAEDQIYAMLDAGKAVVAMHVIPGEILSEIVTPEFNRAATEMGQ